MSDAKQRQAAMRDRLAFVYATGQRPTHTRSDMNTKLNPHLEQVGRRCRVREEIIRELCITTHPMVVQTIAQLRAGYDLDYPPTVPVTRRPYSYVRLARRRGSIIDLIQINLDGSIKEPIRGRLRSRTS